jgi:hypothetical protein
MSTYLTIYIQPKEGKPIGLISYSSSNEIYNYFRENMNIVYLNDESEKYTEITIQDINNIYDSVKSDFFKLKNKIDLFKTCANGNSEILYEILECEECLDELTNIRHIIRFLRELIGEATFSSSDYTKVLCNIG